MAKGLIAGKEPFVGEERLAWKELIPGKGVIAHVDVASGESKIVATRFPETTRDNSSGDEPEWRVVVSLDLTRLDLRHSEFARRIGLSFRFTRCLAPLDDVTTVGGRLRESNLV